MNERRSGAQGHGRASSGPPVVYGDAGVTGSGAADGSTPPRALSPTHLDLLRKGLRSQVKHLTVRPVLLSPNLGPLVHLLDLVILTRGGPCSAPGADGAVLWWKLGMAGNG